jgi:class 3 adenylate cyclase
MTSAPEGKAAPFQTKTFSTPFWAVLAAIVSGGACWYFTKNWMASLASGLGAAVVLSLSAWELWRTARQELFVELQFFLLRCKILPEDYKVIRRAPLFTIETKKQELMNLASSRFQEGQRKLTETKHVLDKFVGTRASQFASEKGKQAVWEGELTRAIVLFSDVRGFTSMAEKLKPQETLRYLNRMFTELEEVIAFSGGEINKYIGDAILAFFPYPQENPQQAVKKAVLAALRMQDSFHQVQMTFQEHYSESIHTGLGVGMAGGDVIIGNLGSARRMEFTLIGDTVNLASRLCSIAEDGQILINQDLALTAADFFRMSALDPVHIKGKSGTHRPYSVVGEKLQPGLA